MNIVPGNGGLCVAHVRINGLSHGLESTQKVRVPDLEGRRNVWGMSVRGLEHEEAVFWFVTRLVWWRYKARCGQRRHVWC
jgi:hypothetical protein